MYPKYLELLQYKCNTHNCYFYFTVCVRYVAVTTVFELLELLIDNLL